MPDPVTVTGSVNLSLVGGATLTSAKTILGADTLLLVLALPDAQAHAPNETFPAENFAAGIRLHQNLLRELTK